MAIDEFDLADVSLRYPGSWTLDEAGRDGLRLFLARSEKLSRLGRYRYPVAAEFRVDFNTDQVSCRADLPSEDALRSAATAARLFFQEREPIHFYKVCNLLWRAAGDVRFRRAIAAVRERYSQFLRHPLSGTWEDRTGLRSSTRAELLDAFFNGDIFHHDSKFEYFIGRIEEGFGPAYKQLFAQALCDFRGHVAALVPIVENALGLDQLARCPCEKAIQAHLATLGVGPVAITVGECLSGATDPPTRGMRCDLDIVLPDQSISSVAGFVLRRLREHRPGYPEYACWYRNQAGEPVGHVLPGGGG